MTTRIFEGFPRVDISVLATMFDDASRPFRIDMVNELVQRMDQVQLDYVLADLLHAEQRHMISLSG